MRLLNIDSLEVEEFIGSSLPPYTILSHTWGLEEVTLQDLPKFGLTRLVGFRKLQYLCDQTRQDGFQYTWVDTCCIDRESSAELSEAINSMYKWYSKAEVCYVYLCDVHYTEGEDIDPTSAFYHSRWFARSWTLQELIAPDSLTFYDAYWRCIGTKKSLFHIVSAVTGIPQLCLEGKEVPADFSVATRFSWASKRSCTRPEDIAYSLMGLFGVYMPLLYGEGEKAFFRLQEEIVKSIDDQSIFSWAVSNEDSRCGKPSSIFARSPADFATAANIYPFAELQTPPYFTSRGLSISLPLVIASKSFISSLSRDCELDDLSRIQVAYLNCGPDIQRAVQIFLVSSPPSAVIQSSPATFHRLAAPLMVAERCHDLEYRNVYIRVGLENLLRSRDTVPYHNMTELVSNLGKGSVPPSPSQDLSITDSSFTKNGFVPEETVLGAVVDILNEKMGCNVAGRLFLPQGTLNRILDDDVMLRSLRELPQTPGHTTKKIEYLFPRCRKIFAILALSGLLRFFQVMVDRLGVSDECLPMPDPEFFPTPTLLMGNRNADHLEKWKLAVTVFKKKAYMRIFFEKQWCVLAPIFRRRGHIQHYSFSHHHILPFIPNGTSANRDMKLSSCAGIQRVYIHPDHYDFGVESDAHFLGHDSIYEPTNLFAVKTLHEINRKDFEMEKTALGHFRNLDSVNILQLLASYETQGNNFDGTFTTYNMLFPWPDGNLMEIWESGQYSRDESIVPWIAEQCWKLADALKTIHAGYLDCVSNCGKPEPFYGIHGDINPPNILRFSVAPMGKLESLGRLVISNFGLTEFHREATRSNPNPFNNTFSTTYAAPELRFQNKSSRGRDVWALGCSFLEFIIWFLMGPDSVFVQFKNLRVDTDTSGVPCDSFCELKSRDDDRPPSARLKPVVLEWIHMLSTNEGCSRYLSDFLGLIQTRMLVTNSQDRIQAGELSQKLKQMYLNCLSKPQYYQANNSDQNLIPQGDDALTDSRESSKRRQGKRGWLSSLSKK